MFNPFDTMLERSEDEKLIEYKCRLRNVNFTTVFVCRNVVKRESRLWGKNMRRMATNATEKICFYNPENVRPEVGGLSNNL